MKQERNNLLHVAIIMDGNGRWAENKKLTRIKGHEKGLEQLLEICKEALELNIKYLTVYAFSTENWHRPKSEVTSLMQLLEDALTNNLDKLKEDNIKLNILGDISKFNSSLVDLLNKGKNQVSSSDNFTLNLALNYGSRQEILQASKKVYQEIQQEVYTIDEIDEDIFAKYLYTNDMPDPDLLIRTAGEMRLSNFLLWQLSYTELYITDKLWPDFTKDDFKNAINDYYSRIRKFGKLNVKEEN